MQTIDPSSDNYDFYDAKPSLNDLQSHGYAEVYARNNEEHFPDDPFVFVPPTIEEMETAYGSASRDDNGGLCVRGVTYEVDLSSADLRYKATAFRPDANGEEFYVEPVYEDGRIIDLIWSTADDWGFTTGRGAVLGAQNLLKTYTAELPLHVYSDPHRYWEHLDDEEDLAKEDAVCILTLSARALLPAVGHVQVFWWDDVEELAEGFFTDYPERVSAFQDQEAFDAFVKRAALWERFDNMRPATPPAGPRLTWAHAKLAIRARRKTNAETGLDGFEEIRAGVRAKAAESKVRDAINTWRNDPSDGNKLLAQRACMPFHLRDIVFAGMTRFVSFHEWERRQAESIAVPEKAPEPKPDVKSVECLFQRVGLLDAKPREYLVKGFIPRNEVCNPFGRPDSFKGVSAAQLAVHIAGGVAFLEMPVKQAPTAYFAGERAEQVKRRIKGHIRRLRLPHDLPCYFGGKPIDLLSKPDLDFLIANIAAIESDAGSPLGFLVIDTQSRTFGGDENSTRDGATYARAIEAIRQATKATLWIIAHTGHSEEAQDRPRGSSALLGAYDTFYRHKKIDERSGEIKITIDRDGLGGKELPFAVELYDTGAVNEDGERVMVPYLEAAAAPVRFTFKKGDEPGWPTPNETLMLKALRAAIKKSPRVARAEDACGSLMEGAKYVFEAEWRDEFRTLYKTGSTRQAQSQAFTKGRDGLAAKGFVDNLGSCYWPTMTAPN